MIDLPHQWWALRDQYRRRYYDPASGRFVSPDPADLDPNSTYRYIFNNSPNLNDPMGLGAWNATGS